MEKELVFVITDNNTGKPLMVFADKEMAELHAGNINCPITEVPLDKTPLYPLPKNRKKRKAQAPTDSEISEYGIENGYSLPVKKIQDYYLEKSKNIWVDKNGNTVMSWKHKLRGFWFNEEYKIREVGVPGAKTGTETFCIVKYFGDTRTHIMLTEEGEAIKSEKTVKSVYPTNSDAVARNYSLGKKIYSKEEWHRIYLNIR